MSCGGAIVVVHDLCHGSCHASCHGLCSVGQGGAQLVVWVSLSPFGGDKRFHVGAGRSESLGFGRRCLCSVCRVAFVCKVVSLNDVSHYPCLDVGWQAVGVKRAIVCIGQYRLHPFIGRHYHEAAVALGVEDIKGFVLKIFVKSLEAFYLARCSEQFFLLSERFALESVLVGA